MAAYRLYKQGCSGPFRTVRVRAFNVPAFIFGPLWLLRHKAYIEALGFVVLMLALWAGGLNLIFAVIFTNGLIAVSSLSILDRKLKSDGWEYITSLEANDEEDCISLFMDPFESLKKG